MRPTEGALAKSDARRRVLACVEEHQGAHLRDLARRLATPLGTILYHLNRLESAGLVVGRQDLGYKRYFAGHSLGIVEKEILGALRRTMPRRIAVVLVEARAATQSELCARIGASKSTLSFHVNDLIGRRVLRSQRWDASNRYMLEEPDVTARLLQKYGASLGLVGVPLAALHLEASAPIAGGA